MIEKLNAIDISELQNKTFTRYAVASCMYNGTDCRYSWTRVGTIMGQCIRLDINKITTITSKAK